MKLLVTPELTQLLRMIRMQNHISAKDLASHMKKSPSYISKLESGDVKTIQKEDLKEMLIYISEGKDFYAEVLPSVVRVLRSFMKAGRMMNQIWLLQYDVMERMVQVPQKMVEDICQHLAENHISIPTFVELMNANFDSEMSASFLPNELISLDYEGSSRFLVRLSYTVEDIEEMLVKHQEETTYFRIYSVVHAMFRFLNYPEERHKLPPNEAVQILRQASTYMEQWGLHSLVGFSHILGSDEFIGLQEPASHEGLAVIEHISELLHEIAGYDALLTARQLNTFCDTLNWDAAFGMKILGIAFADLGEMSFQNKRHLLEEIQELIDKYDRMSDFDKKFEAY